MLSLFFQYIKERFFGNKNRANALLGFVKPPAENGKVIWLVAHKSRYSVLLAVTLLAAIRQKRKDVRLVLTYQSEYPDLIVEHLSGLKKIGFGYSCADHPLAVRRMYLNLSPYAVIHIAHEPHKSHLETLKQLNAGNLIAYQFPTYAQIGNGFRYSACYPVEEKPGQTEDDNCDEISPAFNVLSRLVHTNIDKQLSSLLCGSRFKGLFHIHNSINDHDLIPLWRDNVVAKDYLLVLSYDIVVQDQLAQLLTSIESAGLRPVLLSKWDKNVVSEDSVIVADDSKWFVALCASSISTHMMETEQIQVWQSLAVGSSVSRAEQIKLPMSFENVVPEITSYPMLLEYWQKLDESSAVQRKTNDELRKVFWSARRLAEEQSNHLLNRVYDL